MDGDFKDPYLTVIGRVTTNDQTVNDKVCVSFYSAEEVQLELNVSIVTLTATQSLLPK